MRWWQRRVFGVNTVLEGIIYYDVCSAYTYSRCNDRSPTRFVSRRGSHPTRSHNLFLGGGDHFGEDHDHVGLPAPLLCWPVTAFMCRSRTSSIKIRYTHYRQSMDQVIRSNKNNNTIVSVYEQLAWLLTSSVVGRKV